MSADDDAKRAKLVELAKSSDMARYALGRISALEEEIECARLQHNEELTEATHDLEDWRKMVTAIEALVQERLTSAYTAGDFPKLQLLEELAAAIAKTKADWS